MNYCDWQQRFSFALVVLLCLLPFKSGAEIPVLETPVVVESTELPAAVSVERQQFETDIKHFNESGDAVTLQRIRDYLEFETVDVDRLNRVGRELVIKDETVPLLLSIAEQTFRSGDIKAANALGFIVLRLDASGFWQDASLDQQIRFEALVSAIIALPEENVHRFTRYMASRAHERMEVKEEPGPAPLMHYMTRRQRFEILGTDYNAIQSVGMIARGLEQIVADYLPYIDDLPLPLWVRIETSPVRDPAFQLQVNDNGNVGVILFWNEQTSIQDVSEALSWALLQRIAIWRWNIRDERAVPYWLWQAIATEIPANLQTARNQGLARDVAEVATFLPLTELLNLRAVEGAGEIKVDDSIRLQSLWFYRNLRDQASSRQMFGMMIEAFLAEQDGMAVLQQAFADQTLTAAAAQEWWEIGLTQLVHRQQGVIYSLQQSNALIESLSGVTAWWDGQDRRLRGPALLPLREDPRWQSAFWRKQRELKLELQRVNPIYFNALLSLGHFYELLLARGGPAQEMSSADLRRASEAAYARFSEDWVYAQALHRAVDEALQAESN